MTIHNRRTFLKGMGAMSFAGSTGIAGALGSFTQAHAADTSGYKALVCLFLKGGMDGHDTVLPFDTDSYNSYADIRQPLLNQYNNQAGGSTRARARLLPLNPTNAATFGSREFALPEELAPIHALFEDGKAAIVGNVGPLIQPTDRQAYQDRSVPLPGRLFSHNDQQSTWMASAPEGARFGWGGRFADAAIASGANTSPIFSAISAAGNEVFLVGDQARQYQVGSGGALNIDYLTRRNYLGSGRNSDEARRLLEEHFRATGQTPANLFEQDAINVTRRAVDANAQYNQALESSLGLTTTFPDSSLGRQLSTVAETIAIRDSLGARRQVFFVATGGFDTHDGQAGKLPGLHGNIAGSAAAFYAAMEELGVQNDVVLFTASDFGRTLRVNGDGTDHGWGSHHFVIGGAVNGQTIYGDMPPSTFDHSQDAGRGRLIPSVSVEQYAAAMGRWFGLEESELNAALPGLSAFGGGSAAIPLV